MMLAMSPVSATMVVSFERASNWEVVVAEREDIAREVVDGAKVEKAGVWSTKAEANCERSKKAISFEKSINCWGEGGGGEGRMGGVSVCVDSAMQWLG